MDFIGFGKIPRLNRTCTLTEKIDGTNAQIYIADNLEPITLKSGRQVPFLCGSRTRWIFPEDDNYGFANWAYSNEEELLKLGSGSHFGEWWGKGIQRGYGLDEKRFSLFNVDRWDNETKPSCCHVVPTLYRGLFLTSVVRGAINDLLESGSVAEYNYMKPEGVMVYHHAAKQYFKVTCEKDEQHKGA